MLTNAQSAYRSAEVTTLSQRDLIVKLYAGAEGFLLAAAAAIEARQFEEAHLKCQRAKAIFSELASTLNFVDGGEIALRLKDLYTFFLTHITKCNLLKDGRELVLIVPMVADLRASWEAIPSDLSNCSATSGTDGHTLDIRT